MPVESFSLRQEDDDLKEYVESLPNKSEVIRQLLREHRDGSAAQADVRIAEIDERIEEIDDEMDALETERAELEDERAHLVEQREQTQNTQSVEEKAVAMAEELVTIKPNMRRRVAERKATEVPTPVREAVLDEVDIHRWRDERNVAEGPTIMDDLDAMGIDTDDIVADEKAASIPDGHEAAEVLAGLTEREEEEVREVAAAAK